MHHPSEPAFVLHCPDADHPPALVGVEARGHLDGVLHTLTLRQTYRNAGTEPMEVVYTFPLPSDAVLLGLAAEFEGKRLEGRVLVSDEAESTYEQALADGDAPVLLEVSRDGLHTANLGNLKPGETVTLEVRYARLLAFEQGRLRVSIPTTVAPRYGDPAQGGLQPQQVPEASLSVEYPLSVSLTVAGSLASGEVQCPTHAHRIALLKGAVRLDLSPGATLDRDVVFVVTPDEPNPDLVMWANDAASDTAPKVAIATVTIPPQPTRTSVAVRLLVDCSGSMGGDSIDSARRALRAVVDSLGETDEASLTRFGSAVRHVVGAGPCDPRRLDRLRTAIDETDANLGGTEMEAALQAVFSAWPRRDVGADVLLITDGEIWDAQTLVESARRSGYRVFAIGVGSAPAEGMLRELAEVTGGAVEFATPGESLENAAQRMLRRVRQVSTGALEVDWGAEPAWQLPLPRQAFGGDTVLAIAGFGPGAEPDRAARLVAKATRGGMAQLARTAVRVRIDGQDLARIAAARRMVTGAPEAAMRLALDYQLLSRHTKYVLVHERADEDRVTTSARLQRVPSMLAAGWGGTATARMDLVAHRMPLAAALPSTSPRFACDPMDGDSGFETPPPMDLSELARRVHDFVMGGGAVADLVVEAQDWNLPPQVERALAETDELGIGRAEAWLLLALWVAAQDASDATTPIGRLLTPHLADVADEDRQAAWAVFARTLADAADALDTTRRKNRLAAAMRPGLRKVSAPPPSGPPSCAKGSTRAQLNTSAYVREPRVDGATRAASSTILIGDVPQQAAGHAHRRARRDDEGAE